MKWFSHMGVFAEGGKAPTGLVAETSYTKKTLLGLLDILDYPINGIDLGMMSSNDLMGVAMDILSKSDFKTLAKYAKPISDYFTKLGYVSAAKDALEFFVANDNSSIGVRIGGTVIAGGWGIIKTLISISPYGFAATIIIDNLTIKAGGDWGYMDENNNWVRYEGAILKDADGNRYTTDGKKLMD